VNRALSLRSLFLAAALAAGLAAPAAADEKSLLAADGTLYEVRSGRASDLGLAGAGLLPDDYVIEWITRTQDGPVRLGVVPGTQNRNAKRNLDLAFDEASGKLLLLWKEELSVLNKLHLGVFRDNTWTISELLPNLGFAHAFNPQMRLSHPTVRIEDSEGNPANRTLSLLSVIWWEESQYAQARYAPIFLDDESSDLSSVAVYDLPVLAGGGGPTTYDEVPSSAYLFPSLHSDGPAGPILASFADLHARKSIVVRITFPTDLGKPSDENNITWQRRHIPIVGVVGEAPLVPTVPIRLSSMSTTLGAGYRPTHHWRDGDRLFYTRFDGREWASARAIQLDETMSYDRALALVVGMATSN